MAWATDSSLPRLAEGSPYINAPWGDERQRRGWCSAPRSNPGRVAAGPNSAILLETFAGRIWALRSSWAAPSR